MRITIVFDFTFCPFYIFMLLLKGADGAEHIYLPLETSMVKEFLDQVDSLL
jgi:predicted nucleic acid-binding Zn finger protein